MNIFKKPSLILFFLFIIFNNSSAQTKHSSPFKIDFTKEAILFGTGLAVGVPALIIQTNLQPLTIEEINSLNPDDVNSFDRSAIGPKRDDLSGDMLLFASYALPLTALLNDEAKKDFPEILLMYGETLLITAGVTGVVKGTVKRTRPYAYSDETPMNTKRTPDARVSFFSGHTSVAAANTFFTANILTTYISDKTTQIIIWAAAALYPAISAYLRVDTANHFPTDVITGYIVGAGIGFLVPELHKIENATGLSFSPVKTYGGGGFAITFRF